jgi:hypothetical protein
MTPVQPQSNAEEVMKARFSEALELCIKLHGAKKTLEGKGSKIIKQRLSAMASLVFVLEYLRAIPGVCEQLEPLENLAAALYEVLEGTRSPLFEVAASPHRPTASHSHSILKFQTAACVDRLAHNGLKREKARQYVKGQWKALGVRQPNGKEIGQKLIEAWEGWVRASPAGSAVHKANVGFKKYLAQESVSLAEAKKIVQQTGKTLAQKVARKDLRTADYLKDSYPPKYPKIP